MTRKLLASNVAVVALFLVGLFYVLLYLVRYNPVNPPYELTVELAETGGLYTNSDVTYLGSPVGDIKEIRPTTDGVEVVVAIKSGVEIPKDVKVVVAGLSPVGEQYLDFQPATDEGPYLEAGDTIPAEDTATPIAFSTMMRHVYELAVQIDPKPVRTVVTELAEGLGDAQGDLRQIVLGSSQLLDTLEETEPDTVALLNDGHTVLDTAVDLRPQLERFSRSARHLAHELARGVPTWRQAFEHVPPSLDQLMVVLEENTDDLARFMDESDPFLTALSARGPALTALLHETPAAAAALAPFIYDGGAHGVVYLELGRGECAYGPTQVDPPWIEKRPQVDLTRTCRKYADDLQQRGSYYAPRP